MTTRVQQLASHFSSTSAASDNIENTTGFLNILNMSSDGPHPITLYTAQTPNGVKISIALEELGLPYNVQKVSLMKNEQKEDWFIKLNPNGRIPTIEDKNGPDGKPISVFESGAILLYLVDTYDKDYKLSYPKNSREYFEMLEWIFFQNAGVGPMQGQANHFFRYAPEKIQYGINRYQNETRRLYGVLNKRLEEQSSGWLVGDHISIADVTTVGWVNSAPWAGIDLDEFPKVKDWLERIRNRPAARKGFDVPEPSQLSKIQGNKEEEDKHAAEAGKWVQEGMKQDAQKPSK